MRIGLRSALIALIVAGCSPGVASADWTETRGGPGRNVLADSYPGAKLDVLWTSEVTSSKSGCVVVAGQQAFAVGTSEEDPSIGRLYALDVRTGAIRWRGEEFGVSEYSSGSRCPSTDGVRVYLPRAYNATLGQSAGIAAFDVATGERLWLSVVPNREARSPGTVVGTRVVFNGYDLTCEITQWDCTFALDAATGERVWAKPGYQMDIPPLAVGGAIQAWTFRDPPFPFYDAATGATLWNGGTSMSMYYAMGFGGRLFHSRGGTPAGVVSSDARTGAIHWERALPTGQVPGTLVADDAHVYVGIGYGDDTIPGRVTALDRQTGGVVWTVRRAHAGNVDISVLGGRVLAGSEVFDATTGNRLELLEANSLPMLHSGSAYDAGTVFEWGSGPATGQAYRLRALRDLEAPVIGDALPADGTVMTDTQPRFSWALSDTRGSGVASITLTMDGRRLTVPASGWQPATPLSDGTYPWRLEATDASGNIRSIAQRALVVDTNPPSPFELSAPSAGERVPDARPTLTWETARDQTSGVRAYRVTVGDRSFEVGPEHCAEGRCSASTPWPVADGPQSWSVTARDRAGLERVTSGSQFTVAGHPTPALRASSLIVSTGSSLSFDAVGSSDPQGSALTYAFDLDGDGTYERSTGTTSRVTTSFAGPGARTVSVRVTDSGGLSASASATVDVRRAAPPGELGVSINGGAVATNDPRVMVSTVWPEYAQRALISNDGGFGAAGGAAGFDVAPALAWTLASSGPERLPKTVYVRFRGGTSGRETYTDDIILDETVPKLDGATATGGPAMATTSAVTSRMRLRVRARDNAAGIVGIQATTSKRRPGRITRVRRARSLIATVTVRVPRGRLVARVIDAAGNASAWRTVSRPRR